MNIKLSVIIVSYKVPVFLEQCLLSLSNAVLYLKEINAYNSEIIVIDNQSQDESTRLTENKFPHVRLIKNSRNEGFSKANNKAFRQARGEYVLFLNPDTLVPEDLFTDIIPYMDKHPNAGALGVKMIDADGNFQPESKRAYPNPARALGHLFGLAYFFPHSKKFNGYLLNRLSPDAIHRIEILSGAFMLIRRKAAEKIGLFDERFFMFGEDIDLSYRILKAGYENIYYGKKTVIHYKGESTKKDSHRYVSIFYQAMQIFVNKHIAPKSRLGAAVLQTGIKMRAGVAHTALFLKKQSRLLFKPAKPDVSLKNILLLGNADDVHRIRGFFCRNDRQCFIQAVFNTPENSSSEEVCLTVKQITARIKIDTIIFNAETQSIRIFMCILEESAGQGIRFYTLANEKKYLIGCNCIRLKNNQADCKMQ